MSRRRFNVAERGLPDPFFFALLVATPPPLRLPTLSVFMSVCLRSTSSGVGLWTLREFARFIRSLESNFSTTLQKILSGLPSTIFKDAVFHSSVEDSWTAASRLSAAPTSFRTVLQTSSLPEISSVMSDDITVNYVSPSLNDAFSMGSSAHIPRSSLPNEIEFCDGWVHVSGSTF